MGDDASDNLSNENWQLIADLGDSPIISADVTSPDLNAYFGASLNFSPYGYYGKRNGDEKESNYVSAHCYYNSNDYEAFLSLKMRLIIWPIPIWVLITNKGIKF